MHPERFITEVDVSQWKNALAMFRHRGNTLFYKRLHKADQESILTRLKWTP